MNLMLLLDVVNAVCRVGMFVWYLKMHNMFDLVK